MDAWVYDRAADIGLPSVKRVRQIPRDPDLTTWAIRSASQILLRTLLHIYNRLEITGRENLPGESSFIMVCNHSSHLDAVCLLSALPFGRVHSAFPLAAADYFFSTPLRSILSMTLINALPLDRAHHTSDGLELCREVLLTPNSVLIMFPEGTRSCSAELGRFRSGVARLTAGTSTPVVPCHLTGAFEAWPKGRVMPHPTPLQLRIGRPRVFRDVPPADRVALAAASALLRDDVAALAQAAAPFGLRSDSGNSASISSSE